MNKNLKNTTLRRGCTEIISLETFKVNIFQKYMPHNVWAIV